MSEYLDGSEAFKLRREFSDVSEVEPDLGVDWREKVYNGDVESEVGFAWDKLNFLVGNGAQSRADCGQFKRFNICARLENHAKVGLDGVDYTNKIYHKRSWHHCNKPECPVCYAKGWAVREARRAEIRLNYAAAELGMQIEHIVVSPPQDLDISFGELRQLTLKAMLVRGVVGGLWVYHHFRYRNRMVSLRSGLPIGWFRSPHFHVVGFIKGGYGNCRNCSFQKDGSFVKCREGGCNGFEAVTRRAYLKDGFIAKVKEERKTVGGTVWYQLSHASLRRDVKKHVVVNWFGLCGRNKLKIPKGSLPQMENLCKICGEPLYHGFYHGEIAQYLKLLDSMGIRRSAGVVTNYFGDDGNPLWSAVHDDVASARSKSGGSYEFTSPPMRRRGS